MSALPLPQRLAATLPQPVEIRETNGAWVLLSGERALKLRKPIRLPFLDYSTVEQRRVASAREVAINQPLSDATYLGVRAIVEHGGEPCVGPYGDVPDAVDYAVEMQRFDERRTMAALGAGGRLSSELIDAVGLRLAAFHAAAGPCPRSGRAAFADRVHADLDDLQGLSDTVFSLRRYAAAALRRRGAELDRRAERRLRRDGHGDLRAEHIVFGDDLLIVDRLEFDPELRCTDVGSDLAFLLMDLEDRGGRWVAERLVAAYRRAGGDPGDRRLRALFAWQRAVVRAKIALIRDDHPEAGRLLELADRLAWRERTPQVLLIAGPPASGKSTLAAELARRTRLPVVATDPVRKRLLGAAGSDRLPPDAYRADTTRAVYREVGRRASRELSTHDGVIVDATARTRQLRSELLRGVGGAAQMTAVTCQVPASTQAEWAQARLGDQGRISDADPDIAARLSADFEPIQAGGGIDLAVTVDAARPLPATVQDVAGLLDDA